MIKNINTQRKKNPKNTPFILYSLFPGSGALTEGLTSPRISWYSWLGITASARGTGWEPLVQNSSRSDITKGKFTHWKEGSCHRNPDLHWMKY